jgi:hypothetical protein
MQHTLSFHRPRTLLCGAAILAVLCVSSLGGRTAAAASPNALVPSIGLIPFPGDVYTLTAMGALIPADPASTPPSAPLYNLGGQALNLTWGAWEAATGMAYVYESPGTQHPETVVGITLKGLIPHGVYSIFYRTFSPNTNNPLCPNVEPSLALPSLNPVQQPDRSSFVANSSGEAFFIGVVAGHLLDAQQVQYSVIYHFDGKTYGALANQAEAASQPLPPGGTCRSSYGIDAMRQLLIIQK